MHMQGMMSASDRKKMEYEIDVLAASGITVVRVSFGTEGPDAAYNRVSPTLQKVPGVYDEQLLDGLDYLLYYLGTKKIRAIGWLR